MTEGRKRCWPWNHAWTKWIVVSSGKLARTVDGLGLPTQPGQEIVFGQYEHQRRTCENCGKSQMRETRT